MRPGRPVGGRAALSMRDVPTLSDPDLVSRVLLARVRVARAIVPVDLLEPLPRPAEWALAAVLHDLVQTTHPGFDATLRRSGPTRLLDVIEATLERIAGPADAGEALARHAWLGRMFDITRTDTELRWWTGSATFLGEDPPARLAAWPELRRVHTTRDERSLMSLPTAGAIVSPPRFEAAVELLLERTPLTWFAAIGSEAPRFRWTEANLGLVGTRAGRTMATRLLDRRPPDSVAASLGRATRSLLEKRETQALHVAVDVLRERVVAFAEAKLASARERAPLMLPADTDDAAFALAVGALAATTWLREPACGLPRAERDAIVAMLAPASRSGAAREVLTLMGA